METEDLLSKLDLIEEQARRTLEEFPQHLVAERQRVIISLARHVRWALAGASPRAVEDPEATVHSDDPEATVRQPS